MSATKKCLLIVEDNTALRQMLSWGFEELGYQVVQAGNCTEARKKISAGHFDLALLDYQLPDGNGIELMTRLHESSPGLPVIVSSGIASGGKAKDALFSGAYQFIAKPASVTTLNALFEAALAL